jgi:hypothetical protein
MILVQFAEDVIGLLGLQPGFAEVCIQFMSFDYSVLIRID